MKLPVTQTIDAGAALKEAMDAYDLGAAADEVMSWLRAWNEGWGGDSFDDWDGIEPTPSRAERGEGE